HLGRHGCQLTAAHVPGVERLTRPRPAARFQAFRALILAVIVVAVDRIISGILIRRGQRPLGTVLHSVQAHDDSPVPGIDRRSVTNSSSDSSSRSSPISTEASSLWKRSAISRAASAASVPLLDRKSTRLNSSHVKISYAVFCLKKKN